MIVQSPSADRGLRRLVADLTELHADDMAAILDTLDADERRRVEILLRAYTGGDEVRPAMARAYDGAVFSPWLTRRLESGEGMTPHAYHALQSSAAKLHPLSETVAPRADTARPSLLARLVSALPVGARLA